MTPVPVLSRADLPAAVQRRLEDLPDCFLYAEPLFKSGAYILHFSSYEGLRAHGQTSLVAAQDGSVGLVVTGDGRVPNNAESWALLSDGRCMPA